MKYVHLNVYFKLPEGFEGDLNDAIEELLKYRRGEKNHNYNFKYNPAKTIYENWWKMINTTDRVLYGEVDLGELNIIENEWMSEISKDSPFICKPKD